MSRPTPLPFTLSNALQEVFGKTSLPFYPTMPAPGIGQQAKGGSFEQMPAAALSEEELLSLEYQVTSPLGASYVCPVKIEIERDSFFQLWLEPVVTLQMVKRIVTTPLAGRRKGQNDRPMTDVKELVQWDSHRVGLEGFIIHPDPAFQDRRPPTSEIRKLYQIFRQDWAIAIRCPLLEAFDIRRVVITEVDILPPPDWGKNLIPFRISALADTDIEQELRSGIRKKQV